MLRPSLKLGLALLVAACLAFPSRESLAQSPAPQPPQASSPSVAAPASANAVPARKFKARAMKTAPVVEDSQPQAPAPTPTLEQQPPAPPQVSYKNGQLTIDSQNATLSQVLHSVQSQTGATLDMPPGAGSERVVAKLGPGKPKDVLSALLNGSKFNYVILGEPNNSGAVQKVILMAASAAPAGGTSPQGAPPVNYQPPMQPQAAMVEPPEEPDDQQNEPEPENQPVAGQPGMPGADGIAPDGSNPGMNQAMPGGRTPEQMLQELQKMQQQQQQYQQQLNPANQQPLQQQPQQMPFPSQPQVQPQ